MEGFFDKIKDFLTLELRNQLYTVSQKSCSKSLILFFLIKS